MSLPFDATLKELVQDFPLDWATALDMPPSGPVEVLTPDLSTLTAFADVVLHLGDRLLHIDFQSGPDSALPRRLMLYNVVLFDRYELPVHTVVVLLRPRADRGDLLNRIAYAGHPGRGGMEFEFEIVRLWEMPVEKLLTAGLGLLPLALLGQLPTGLPTPEAMRPVVARILERAANEAAAPLGPVLETAAFILAGLRISRETAVTLFQGVREMRESTTYQYILDEGRAEGLAKGRAEGRAEARVAVLRQTLLRLGRIRLGEPDTATCTAFEAISDPERLERLTERLLQAVSWEEVLATP